MDASGHLPSHQNMSSWFDSTTQFCYPPSEEHVTAPSLLPRPHEETSTASSSYNYGAYQPPNYRNVSYGQPPTQQQQRPQSPSDWDFYGSPQIHQQQVEQSAMNTSSMYASSEPWVANFGREECYYAYKSTQNQKFISNSRIGTWSISCVIDWPKFTLAEVPHGLFSRHEGYEWPRSGYERVQVTLPLVVPEKYKHPKIVQSIGFKWRDGIVVHGHHPWYSQPLRNEPRFKTLPGREMLPKDEQMGGHIFICNDATMQEQLDLQLFGLPSRYKDSVRTITPGIPLFLYNFTSHKLHGVYEAVGFGGYSLHPTAWKDTNSFHESRFPSQVEIKLRKLYTPLHEEIFRGVLNHYDGLKFVLQLSIAQVLDLFGLFVAFDMSEVEQ